MLLEVLGSASRVRKRHAALYAEHVALSTRFQVHLGEGDAGANFRKEDIAVLVNLHRCLVLPLGIRDNVGPPVPAHSLEAKRSANGAGPQQKHVKWSM